MSDFQVDEEVYVNVKLPAKIVHIYDDDGEGVKITVKSSKGDKNYWTVVPASWLSREV